MIMHLIKIQTFTHASRVTKFSCTCVMYVHVYLRYCTSSSLGQGQLLFQSGKRRLWRLHAKHRKDLVVDLGKRDFADIVDSAIAMTQHKAVFYF